MRNSKNSNRLKVAFIAGANSRLASEIIRHYSSNGWQIIAASREEPSAASNLGNCLWIPMDITNIESIDRAIEEAYTIHPCIHTLIQCTGFYPKHSNIIDTPIHDITTDIKVTYEGPILLSKYYVQRQMHHHCGRIFYIGSTGSFLGSAGKATYCANKAGITHFARVLHNEITHYGMAAHVISPGQLSSDTNEPALIEQKAISNASIASALFMMNNLSGNAHIDHIEINPAQDSNTYSC